MLTAKSDNLPSVKNTSDKNRINVDLFLKKKRNIELKFQGSQ